MLAGGKYIVSPRDFNGISPKLGPRDWHLAKSFNLLQSSVQNQSVSVNALGKNGLSCEDLFWQPVICLGRHCAEISEAKPCPVSPVVSPLYTAPALFNQAEWISPLSHPPPPQHLHPLSSHLLCSLLVALFLPLESFPPGGLLTSLPPLTTHTALPSGEQINTQVPGFTLSSSLFSIVHKQYANHHTNPTTSQSSLLIRIRLVGSGYFRQEMARGRQERWSSYLPPPFRRSHCYLQQQSALPPSPVHRLARAHIPTLCPPCNLTILNREPSSVYIYQGEVIFIPIWYTSD